MNPVEQARGSGANAPEITKRPYIGILGVFLGAMTSTLNSRLLSVGLPDLRGAIGAGFDEASWLPTLLNMGTMFIGVFAVFLGASYGIRRVLMISGAFFTLLSLLLPLAPNLEAMLVLSLFAGLASGSFYSLTLTFVARSLPPKLIIFGIAAYALDIIVTSNLVSLIYGNLVEHLSWRWIFWPAAILTPLVMVCLYLGVPPADTSGAQQKPSWKGLLYVSLGLSFLYGALDQGQRLDWMNSGLIVAFFAVSAFLLLVATIRRFRQPNPLVNLPFLNARNIVILGLGVFTIRFALLAPLMVIPAFLGNVQQYRALQTGEALAWVAWPQFVLVWIAAIVSVFIQPRIVMAFGFTVIAIACSLGARVDSYWAGTSFLVPELLLALGIAAAFVGLVISLVVLALEMGAIASVANAATFSGCMHAMRILGGEVGSVLLARFLTVREHVHSNLLGQNIDAGNWLASERLGSLAAALAPASPGIEEAQSRAVGVLSLQVRAQAFTMACSDAFGLIAWVIAAYLVLLVFLRPSTINLRQAGQAK